MKNVWDYNLPKNWKPKTDFEWEWYLTRRLNYGDYKGLKKEDIKKYFPKIKDQLDPGTSLMFEDYLYHDQKSTN